MKVKVFWNEWGMMSRFMWNHQPFPESKLRMYRIGPITWFLHI